MHVGGCVARTRTTAIYGEAGLQPIALRAELSAAGMYERLKRLPADNPARAMAERPEPGRAAAAQWRPQGWRRTAVRTVAEAGLADVPREETPTAAPARGALPERSPSFHPYLAERVTRRDSAEKRKKAALDKIASLPRPDVTVYTDGSVLSPATCGHGGGGYYMVDAAGAERRGRCPAGRICSSFHAEAHAVLHALRELAAEALGIAIPRGAEVQVLTDSQSVVRRLARGPWQQPSRLGQQIWEALHAVEAAHGAHV
eukprot:gene19053-biopygen4268